MASEIIMPKLSQTTEEVSLHSWLVKVGDIVKKGDPLCEVETDKTTMEVESFTGGTILYLNGEPGSQIFAGSLIAVIGDPDEDVNKYAEKEKTATTSSEQPTNAKQPAVSADPSIQDEKKSEIKASRLVQNLANKEGIDLSKISGTGPGGWITKKDLENFKSSTSDTAPASGKNLELSENQKKLGRHLQASKSQIPHYYIKISIICDNLFAIREALLTKNATKVSINSILIYSVAKALKQHPEINSYFQDGLQIKQKINVGLAVSNGDELYVPVIDDAGNKSIEEIDQNIKLKIDKVRKNNLESKDILNGTITISNLGSYPVDEFSAIINPPQVAILAIGRIKKEVVVDSKNSVSIRNVCTVTGSFDHRVVNGAMGAEFLKDVKSVLEEDL